MEDERTSALPSSAENAQGQLARYRQLALDYHGLIQANPQGTIVLDGSGQVSYRALKAAPESLERFLARVAKLPAAVYQGWSADARIAFWINTYNAWTLKAILDHYPVRSIRAIPDAWKRLKFTAMGRERSLDEVEHQILRKEFDEPRIHFGLNCASVGCPVLRREPYVAERLGAQLDEQVRVMLADRSKFRIDHAAQVAYISKLFEWYGKDFVPKKRRGAADKRMVQRAVLSTFAGYLSDADRTRLRAADYEVRYLDYDWSLNESR